MFDITLNEVVRSINGHDENDKFDFTKFDPTGFAKAIKQTSEGGDKAEEAASWLTAASFFDPTGWLSVAAAFVKPKCKADTKADTKAQTFVEVHTNRLCYNRGGAGGSNQFSRNVGENQLQACADHVQSVRGCGRWFSYGALDGWCDCVKGDDRCLPTSQGEAEKRKYSVYQIRDQVDFEKQADLMLCHNRGGVGGSNQFSKNVGPNNPQACADYVDSVPGCGRFFSYGAVHGWCDCVKQENEPCKLTDKGSAALGQYAVYELQRVVFEKQADPALCLNGRNEFSTNVGSNNPQACADYVDSVPGCGSDFSYSFFGWCDCVKEEDGPCTHTTDGAAEGRYAVYQLPAKVKEEVIHYYYN